MAGQIKKVKKGDPIYAEDYNALVDEVLRLGKLNVTAPLTMQTTPAGIIFGARLPIWFIAKITGSSQDSTNKRWAYTFQTAIPATAKTFTTMDTGDARSGTAYNLIEINNSSSGSYGNGVSSTNFSGTFDIQKTPTNTYVFMLGVSDTAGILRYFFSYENGVDGGC